MLKAIELLSVWLVLVSCSANHYALTASSRMSASKHLLSAGSLPQFPLHTLGRFIVDERGRRVKLASVNWYGASDTKLVPGGLDRAPLVRIVEEIKELGFNSVRLPFSNLMLKAPKIDPEALRANPELIGLSPLEVYDRVVKALTDQAIMVVINNHTTHPMWCCNFDDDGLWYSEDYSEDQWLDDWAMMARRYRNNPAVIAADLRNEVRIAKLRGTILPNVPNWNTGPNDWRQAAERAGARVLEENPNMLVVVEGINFPRNHLRGVYSEPIRLPVAGHLVYSAHNYGFIAPTISGPTYGAMDEEAFRAQVSAEWGNVTTAAQAYTAPVWVSEFGESFETTDRTWFSHIITYLRDGDFDFAYWALNAGPKASGDSENFSLLSEDWQQPLADWRVEQLRTLIEPRLGPGVENGWENDLVNHFSTLLFSDWDTNQAEDRSDWLPEAFKGRCREGERVVGISGGSRIGQSFAHQILCSDALRTFAVSRTATVLSGDHDMGAVGSHTNNRDWAPKQVKLECEPNAYIAGVAQQHELFRYSIAGILCADGVEAVSSTCHTIDFGAKDHRESSLPGDWDPHHLKVQCAVDEYAAGLALSGGQLRSLLCCSLSTPTASSQSQQ